jgi:polar amino acid transport system substrate-binding protein
MSTFFHRLACCLLLVLCGARAAAADAMVFVMDPFPPYTYERNGVATGPIADTIREVCAAIKAECRFETYPWRRALKLAEDGFVDGIYAVVPLPERAQFFHLTPPIVESSYGVFAQESSPLRYQGPHDLDGYTVGVYGPSAASRALETVTAQAKGVVAVVEIDNTRVLQKLASGRYGEHAAAVVNLDVGRYLLQELHIEGVKVVGRVGKTEYGIGLSRKKVSDQQAAVFNAALAQLFKSGRVRQIVEGYGLQPAGH